MNHLSFRVAAVTRGRRCEWVVGRGVEALQYVHNILHARLPRRRSEHLARGERVDICKRLTNTPKSNGLTWLPDDTTNPYGAPPNRLMNVWARWFHGTPIPHVWFRSIIGFLTVIDFVAGRLLWLCLLALVIFYFRKNRNTFPGKKQIPEKEIILINAKTLRLNYLKTSADKKQTLEVNPEDVS